MKRAVSLFLALAISISLAACAGSPVSNTDNIEPILSAEQVVEALRAACADEISALDQIELYRGEEYTATLAPGLYGIPAEWLRDCATVRAGGASAFELTVFLLNDAADTAQSMDALQNYLDNREGDFFGYFPAQADLVSGALTTLFGQYVGLFICERPEDARDAFLAVLGGGATTPSSQPTQESSAPPSQAPTVGPDGVSYSGRTTFIPPNKDDMTIYDTSAILAAWDSGDPSGLSNYDRTIYDRAAAVLDEVLTDGMSDYEKESALYMWVITHMDYDYDHQSLFAVVSRDSFTPYGGLVKGKGVCLGFSSLFQLLMDMAGVECVTVVGAAYDSKEDHAWNMVRLDGEWYCADATWDWTYYNELGFLYFFNVTSDHMAQTNHQWNYNAVPEATATDGGNGAVR